MTKTELHWPTDSGIHYEQLIAYTKIKKKKKKCQNNPYIFLMIVLL